MKQFAMNVPNGVLKAIGGDDGHSSFIDIWFEDKNKKRSGVRLEVINNKLRVVICKNDNKDAKIIDLEELV